MVVVALLRSSPATLLSVARPTILPMATTQDRSSRNLGRLSEIAQVAARHGFGYFLRRNRLGDLVSDDYGGAVYRVTYGGARVAQR